MLPASPAGASPGTARLQFAAQAKSYTDAAEVKLPVYTPATTEAAAVYGHIDQGSALQPTAAPSQAIPGFGGLSVTTSSTAVQALSDAVLYLSAYPFECSEQIASRLLSLAVLKDVLAALEAPGLPSPENMTQAADRDIKWSRPITPPSRATLPPARHIRRSDFQDRCPGETEKAPSGFEPE